MVWVPKATQNEPRYNRLTFFISTGLVRFFYGTHGRSKE